MAAVRVAVLQLLGSLSQGSRELPILAVVAVGEHRIAMVILRQAAALVVLVIAL
jgi:hypothetical protein